MIELEIYAAGLRELDKVLALNQALGGIQGLRYKVDSNHDIVYFEADAPTFSVEELKTIFRNIGLNPRIVGTPPQELSNSKKKTQPLNF